jgi:hypothetical protein
MQDDILLDAFRNFGFSRSLIDGQILSCLATGYYMTSTRFSLVSAIAELINRLSRRIDPLCQFQPFIFPTQIDSQLQAHITVAVARFSASHKGHVMLATHQAAGMTRFNRESSDPMQQSYQKMISGQEPDNGGRDPLPCLYPGLKLAIL